MPWPPRRVLARYPCDLPVDVHSFMREVRVTGGRLSNLSIGGALIRCRDPLERGVAYFLRFSWKGTLLELSGRVAWVSPRAAGERSYGIELQLTREQESFLRGVVESLRQEAPPPGARAPARDYWQRRKD